MSRSGRQQSPQAEDGDGDGDAAEVVEISAGGRPPAQAKTPRRCVQAKLNFFVSPRGRGRGRGGVDEGEEEEGEEESSGDGGRRKPKRKRKAQSRTPNKVPAIGKEAVGSNAGNRKLLPSVGDGSDFFLKVSEKRRRWKHQREQEDMVDLTVEGDTCSKTLQSVDLLSCDLEGQKSRWWLTSGKLNAAKDPGAVGPSKYQPTVDSCSESKHAEEGNGHTLAMRSTHPFFSRWKTTKSDSEFSLTSKENKNYCAALDMDVLISGPPIHVFETLQDNATSLDWGHWKISERSSLDLSESMALESTLLPVSDVSITPLKFDSTIPFLNPSGAVFPRQEVCLSQLPDRGIDLFAGSEGTLDLTDGQETHNRRVSFLKMFKGLREDILPSKCSGSLNNLENEQQDALSQNSLTLYKLRRDCWTECSLWANKYHPDKAVEVCGNTESVKFLGEWLKSWQERHLQTTKNSMCSNVYINDDSDDSLYQNDSDSENEDEAPLGIVLLVTGPVGCGKSAAIYACVKEQGFQVIEVNASDERNGAHIKQKFGEAMDSHAIELCSIEDDVDLRRKHTSSLMMESSVNTMPIEFKNGDFKEASRLCKAARNECVVNVVENQSSTCRVANKNLFLFEDVDAVFDEDRGFIASIMQLAETSKRPIILTTNGKNPILPRALNKLVVDFTRPSTEELLAHMLMVCAAEGAQASPVLLERLIRSCQGDIRKTILLLQFWCQGGPQDRNTQFAYSPLLFDLDAAHWVITKIIPWAIPCELSLKVEEEIAKAISVAENRGILHSLKEEDGMVCQIDASNTSEDCTGTCTAKEDAMLKYKYPISQHTEFLSPMKDHGDFSDDSGSPLTFARRSLKHRIATVLSSESGDVFAADTTIEFVSPKPNSTLSPDVCDMRSFQPIHHSNYLNPFDNSFGEGANLPRNPFMVAEVASTSHVCDTYLSTSIPESFLVPETEISNREGCLSTSSSHLSGNLEDFLMNNIGSVQVLSQEEVNSVNGIILATSEDPIKEISNIHELDTESVHGNEEAGVSQREAAVASCRRYQLMDECSRAGFGVEHMSVDSFKCYPIVGSVEETWRKLRNRHEDLKSHLSSGQGDAMKILDLSSALTDLVSEADILLRSCQSLISDLLEPSAIPFDEPCSSSCCDEHLEMASTFAEHGLCFYSSKAVAMQPNLGYDIPVYLAQEMLAASTSSMALGKLLSQGMTNLCMESGLQQPSGNGISLGRELESMLCDAVRPIIPVRMCMVLKGPAFHEYISFLSCMSKSENSRLSDNNEQFQRHQRARASRHYLRSHPFVLSPEDVAILAGYSCFGG